jgi:hypothetical protein
MSLRPDRNSFAVEFVAEETEKRGKGSQVRGDRTE